MSRHGGIRDMTVGAPLGHIVLFTLPLLVGNFLQQFYNMVDSWVVGNYVSDAALAAVGVGFPVIFLFTSLFSGIATGGTVVIAQAFGAGKAERVHDAVDTLYTAFVRGIVPLSAAAVLLVEPLMTLLRVDPAARQETRIYLLVVCGGLAGNIGYNLNAGILNGVGNSVSTLMFLGISTLLNILLDFTLVLFADMGVLGVALGTVIAQAVSWLFGLFYINRRYPALAIYPCSGRFDGALFREIIRIGLPAGIQMSLIAVGSMCVLSKVNSYGKAFTAGFNVGKQAGYAVVSAGAEPFRGGYFLRGAEHRRPAGGSRPAGHPGGGVAGRGMDGAERGSGGGAVRAALRSLHAGACRHCRQRAVSALCDAALCALFRALYSQRRHAGRGRQRVPHGQRGGLRHFYPGAGALLSGRPLRTGHHVLELRRGVAALVHCLRLVLLHRALAGKVSGDVKARPPAVFLDRNPLPLYTFPELSFIKSTGDEGKSTFSRAARQRVPAAEKGCAAESGT